MAVITPDIAMERVLGLEFGDILTLTFSSLPEMNSFRLRLFRSRKKMEESLPELAARISVKSNNKNRTLNLSLVPGVIAATVTRATGTVENILIDTDDAGMGEEWNENSEEG